MSSTDFGSLPENKDRLNPPAWKETSIVFAALLMLAFAAYGTTAFNYRFFADDAVLAKGFTDPTAAFRWDGQGAWRFLGNWMLSTALAGNPQAYLLCTVALHGINSFLAWSLLRRVGAQPATSIIAAGLLVVFPGVHEAIAWISASHNVWSTTFFLLTLHVTFRAGAPNYSPVGLALAGFTLALVGNFLHDQFALAYFALPVATLWLQSGRWKLPFDRRLPVLVAPTVGSGLYILAYLLTLRSATTHHPTLNWPSLFSPLVYQYVNFAAFDVWQHPIWVQAFWLRIASPAGMGLLFLLLAGSGALVWLAWRNHRQGEITSSLIDLGPACAAWTALLLGLTSIYAIAGGYSFVSRKRYAIVFLGVLALGHLFRRLAAPRWVSPAAGISLLFFALTSVAITEARNGLLTAKDQLCSAVAGGSIPAATYIVEWDTGPARFGYYLWNDMWVEVWFDYMWKDTWGKSPQQPSPPAGRRPLVRHAHEARHLASYDWSRREWRLIPLAPAPGAP